MNLLHLKYALEVEKTRSINKAAENLFIGQPTLSKSIKKLEEDLGFILFIRTPSGIMPTADGERFLARAHDIMLQADELEAEYKSMLARPSAYALTLPRCPMAYRVLKRFADKSGADIKADFGQLSRAVRNILQNSFDMAVIRYCPKLQPNMTERLEQEGLAWRLLGKGRFMLTFKGTEKPDILSSGSVQVAYEDAPLPHSENGRRVLVRDSAALLNLLELPNSYSWIVPLNGEYGLKQVNEPAGEEYADMSICKRSRNITKYDNLLLSLYCKLMGYEEEPLRL